MRIAVDYDDVLIPFMESFLKWYNHGNNTNHSHRDNRSMDLSITFGKDIQYWVDQMNEFHSSGLSSQLDPHDSAIDVLRDLSGNHDIVILTSRPVTHRSHLEKWIEINAGDVVTDLYMYDHKDQTTHTMDHNKGAKCIDIGASLLIDDHHGHIDAALDHGVSGILYGDHAWNESHHERFEHHATSWDEVRGIVRENYS